MFYQNLIKLFIFCHKKHFYIPNNVIKYARVANRVFSYYSCSRECTSQENVYCNLEEW